MTDEAGNPAAKTKPGLKSARLWTRRGLPVACVLVAALAFVGGLWLQARSYRAYTRSLILHLNNMGRTLDAGQIGTLRIPRSLADEIILVAPYSPAGPNSGLDGLDRDCIMVWMRGRHIAAAVVFPTDWLDFELEDNPRPTWRLDQQGEVRVQVVYNAHRTKSGRSVLRTPAPGNLVRITETPQEVEKP